MKVAYNTSLVPPAPFLSVRVSNPITQAVSAPMMAKVDTGADVTALPAALIDQLSLAPVGEFLVEGYDGNRTSMYWYRVTLGIAHLQMAGLAAIAFAEDYALLGRNVLNALRLFLDGPALSLEVLE